MPYPTELRERAVRAYENGVGTRAAVSTLFTLGTATLGRWVRRKRTEGTVKARGYAGGQRPRIGRVGEIILLALVERQRDATLDELAAAYGAATGTVIGKSVIDRTLTRMGITLKKRRCGQLNERAPEYKSCGVSISN